MENPQLSNGQPVPMQNEIFMLSRSGIRFSAKRSSGKMESSSGVLYLTTLRMVYVGEGDGKSFDMPLATVAAEKFNQPIFGANNMTGESPPLDNATADNWKWCISFRNGGVGTFLPFFFRLLQEMRNRMAAQAQAAATPVVQAEPIPQAIAQGLVQAAFVDPNDPTHLLVSAPTTAGVPVATPVYR